MRGCDHAPARPTRRNFTDARRGGLPRCRLRSFHSGVELRQVAGSRCGGKTADLPPRQRAGWHEQLFGFATPEEREMFLLLISISGIGPKLGCNILSSSSITGLRNAIAAGDTKTLSSLRGIGKKTAERLVVELKDKVGAATGSAGSALVTRNPKQADAVAALVSLGYKQADAQKAVVAASESTGSEVTVEELVRAALRG